MIVSEGEIPGGVIAGAGCVWICHLSRYCNLSCIGFVLISFFVIKTRYCQFIHSFTYMRCYQTFWSLPIWWIKMLSQYSFNVHFHYEVENLFLWLRTICCSFFVNSRFVFFDNFFMTVVVFYLLIVFQRLFIYVMDIIPLFYYL